MKTHKIISVIALLVGLVPYVVFAGTAPTAEDILPKLSVQEKWGADSPKLIPTSDLQNSIVPAAVKMFLGVVATISFVMFLYAGIQLVISQGNEEEMTKFKNMLLWAVIGLLFITLSYAIVSGVLQLNFETR